MLLQDTDLEKKNLFDEERDLHKQTVENLKLRINELERRNKDIKLKVTKL